jgi:hypothetical protein
MNCREPSPFRVDTTTLARIAPMSARDVRDVVRLHRASMGRSLWARLGERFMTELYLGLVEQRDFRGYVYTEDGRVQGFIAGSSNGPRMLREVFRRRWGRLGLATLPTIVVEPRMLLRLAETFGYFFFVKNEVPETRGILAESMFCSFEPELRGKRVSGLINKVLFDELLALGHEYVQITTDDDNALAARQLMSWGFEKLGSFRFYQKEMRAWRLNLRSSERVEPTRRFVTGEDRAGAK